MRKVWEKHGKNMGKARDESQGESQDESTAIPNFAIKLQKNIRECQRDANKCYIMQLSTIGSDE